jgi:DNA-binding Lrp family transcriptional regulator
VIKMPTAYILINYEIGTEDKILNRLKDLSGVVEVSEVNGIYDIVVKITSDNLDDIKETITKHIRTIKTIRSTMTLIVTEDK